jgi:uncharacterized membrane protein YfcA
VDLVASPVITVALAAVLVGTALQRATGFGFALVASPLLVLLFGPEPGVLLVNSAGLLASGANALLDGRRAERLRLAWLAPGALAGVVLGVLVSRSLNRSLLEVVIGGLVIVTLTLSLVVPRRAQPGPPHPGATLGAGLAAGIGGALAGLQGPPMAIYAAATGWRGRPMAATLQVMFAVTAVAAIAAKWLTGTAHLPDAPLWFWPALLATVATGLIVGQLVGRRVPPRAAWVVVVVIAYAGSAATVVHGLSIW